MIREPDEIGIELDTAACTVMAGHQHKASEVDSLACSIAANGQINPVQVIKYDDGRLEIAAGRRRWMACKKLNISVNANIYYCHDDDINVEIFARSIRIAENLEREQPSAMDIAIQLRAIRSEHGFGSSKELAASLGIGESAVKNYMSAFKASDYLQAAGKVHGISIGVLVELTKCEKELGRPTARKLIDRTVSGELTRRDLVNMRKKRSESKTTKKEKSQSRPRKTVVAKARTSFLDIVKSSPSDDELPTSYVIELISLLQERLSDLPVSLVETA